MTPLHKTTEVPLSPQDAFDLFATGLDSWWPKDSHAPLGPNARLIVEPGKNGTITEVGADGTRNVWGEIIAWVPGEYLAFTWHPDGDESEATVVAVSFHTTPSGTRLELTHGGFEVLGPVADAVSTTYLLGWDLVLGSYCFAVNKVKTYA